MMKNMAQRMLMFQVHCMVNILSLALVLFALIFLRVGLSFVSLLALIISIAGLVLFFTNGTFSHRHKIVKECYLAVSLSSCLSLLFASQTIFAFASRFWFANFLFFLVTTSIIGGIIYLILVDCSLPVHNFSLGLLMIGWSINSLISIFFYRTFLQFWLFPGALLWLSYLLWILVTGLTLITCYDLKLLLRRR